MHLLRFFGYFGLNAYTDSNLRNSLEVYSEAKGTKKQLSK